MKKRAIWIALTILMMISLVLASCYVNHNGRFNDD